MKTIETLLTKLNETKKERDELKLWLDQKEIVEYYSYLKEHPEDKRVAFDKIVARLKMEDEEWLLKEQQYTKTKNDYDYLNTLYQTFLSLSSRTDVDIESITDMIDNLLMEVD